MPIIDRDWYAGYDKDHPRPGAAGRWVPPPKPPNLNKEPLDKPDEHTQKTNIYASVLQDCVVCGKVSLVFNPVSREFECLNPKCFKYLGLYKGPLIAKLEDSNYQNINPGKVSGNKTVVLFDNKHFDDKTKSWLDNLYPEDTTCPKCKQKTLAYNDQINTDLIICKNDKCKAIWYKSTLAEYQTITKYQEESIGAEEKLKLLKPENSTNYNICPSANICSKCHNKTLQLNKLKDQYICLVCGETFFIASIEKYNQELETQNLKLEELKKTKTRAWFGNSYFDPETKKWVDDKFSIGRWLSKIFKW